MSHGADLIQARLLVVVARLRLQVVGVGEVEGIVFGAVAVGIVRLLDPAGQGVGRSHEQRLGVGLKVHRRLGFGRLRRFGGFGLRTVFPGGSGRQPHAVAGSSKAANDEQKGQYVVFQAFQNGKTVS